MFVLVTVGAVEADDNLSEITGFADLFDNMSKRITLKFGLQAWQDQFHRPVSRKH